jgi:tripartite ATP-independent transporter DctM subunit
MEFDLNILIPISVMIVLALMNIPIWLAIIGGCLPYFLFLETMLPSKVIVQRIIAMTENSSYLAIPFFISAGSIMNHSGISRRLMDLADALVGHLTGGLAQVNCVLSALMGGISGSSAADAAMECKILVPEMTRRGYDIEFSAAVTVASSMVTPIIPPGMGLIIFAFVTSTSVGRLLAAGYIPGFLLTAFYMLYVSFISKKRGYIGSRAKAATIKEILHQAWKSIWAIIMPFGIILGLRFGLFTATEAGAVCAVYALFVGIFIYREFKLANVWPTIEESILGTATVMILICVANAMSYYMTYEQIPQTLINAILSMNLNKYTFLIFVNGLLLIIGMLMDGSAPLIILAPLLTPIAVKLGVNPVHFGLIFVFNICLGNMTPPFGIVLYQVAGLLQVPLTKLGRQLLPFILIMMLVLFLSTFIPQIVLVIPNMIYGG